MVVAAEEAILMVVGILKDKGFMNRINLVCPILPVSIKMGFSVLMVFGRLFWKVSGLELHS